MHTISLVNMKGGVAKTTLAVNLADSICRRFGHKVLLIDADPQFNATQCLISGDEYVFRLEEGGNTIADVFNDTPRPTAHPVNGASVKKPIALSEIKPWRITPNYHLLAGDLELHRIDMPAGQGRERRLKRFLEESGAEDEYEFVIIDTPPTPSAWMMSALLASDSYIVPVKPEPLSTTGIDLLRGVIDRFSDNFGVKLNCLGVALTMAQPSRLVYRDAVSFIDNNPKWRGKRFKSYIPDRTKIAREQGDQTLILDLDEPDAKRQLAGLTREVLQRLGYEE